MRIPDSLIEHALQITLSQRRAFEVLVSFDLLGHRERLLI